MPWVTAMQAGDAVGFKYAVGLQSWASVLTSEREARVKKALLHPLLDVDRAPKRLSFFQGFVGAKDKIRRGVRSPVDVLHKKPRQMLLVDAALSEVRWICVSCPRPQNATSGAQACV